MPTGGMKWRTPSNVRAILAPYPTATHLCEAWAHKSVHNDADEENDPKGDHRSDDLRARSVLPSRDWALPCGKAHKAESFFLLTQFHTLRSSLHIAW
mmetsp:Transcript_49477/g.123000  ORF Transcript_49477/g.123000 Transcript_49477/m.123000 type:complete len:97 (-) Transcript_49477:21-311(-)